MTVTIHYQAQLRRAAGRSTETLDVPEGITVADLLRKIAASHGDSVGRLVLEGDRPARSLLVFLGEKQIPADRPEPLPDRGVVTLLTPIAGGQGGIASWG